jgi:hypothetical protein
VPADPYQPETIDFRAGYRAGFTTGAEVGAARILLALEHLLAELPELLPDLPYAGEYERLRRLRAEVPDTPCPRRCRCCSRCICADGRARNLARYGSRDFPGLAALRRDQRTGQEAA